MYNLTDLNSRVSIVLDLFKQYLDIYRSTADTAVVSDYLIFSFNRLISAIN